METVTSNCRLENVVGDKSRFHFYEKVKKIKADVAALHIFFLLDIDDAVSGGVESCPGRRLLAFISTLDSSPRHFKIERGTKRNAVQLSFVLSGWVWVLFFGPRAYKRVPTHWS
jgi:hypothetical protein